MNIVIIGGGKLGYNLAKAMASHENEIILIEINKTRCIRLANELGMPVIHGDGTTFEALRQAEVDGFDTLISVTGSDEDNLVACQVGKHFFHIRRTISRANNPKNIETMKDLGVDIVVSSTQIIAHMIENEVDGDAMHTLANLNRGEASISEFSLPESWPHSSMQLMDLDLPKTCVIVAVLHYGVLQIPRGDTRLYGGDRIVILASQNEEKKIKKAFHLAK